jgi:hypothetical protein
MNTPHDFDRTASAWLAEGPTELADRVLEAALREVHLTAQRRRWAAPWRAKLMTFPVRVGASIAAVAIVGAVAFSMFGRGPGFGAQPTPSPTTPATAGRITLTDTGCRWDANPGTWPANAALLPVEFRNETDHFATFILHWVRPGHTWEEGVAYVADLQRRLVAGEDWPANDISSAVASFDMATADTQQLAWGLSGSGAPPAPEFAVGGNWKFATGTYGVVCSANTSATGDIISTFLVGPLEIR